MPSIINGQHLFPSLPFFMLNIIHLFIYQRHGQRSFYLNRGLDLFSSISFLYRHRYRCILSSRPSHVLFEELLPCQDFFQTPDTLLRAQGVQNTLFYTNLFNYPSLYFFQCFQNLLIVDLY